MPVSSAHPQHLLRLCSQTLDSGALPRTASGRTCVAPATMTCLTTSRSAPSSASKLTPCASSSARRSSFATAVCARRQASRSMGLQVDRPSKPHELGQPATAAVRNRCDARWKLEQGGPTGYARTDMDPANMASSGCPDGGVSLHKGSRPASMLGSGQKTGTPDRPPRPGRHRSRPP